MYIMVKMYGDDEMNEIEPSQPVHRSGLEMSSEEYLRLRLKVLLRKGMISQKTYRKTLKEWGL